MESRAENGKSKRKEKKIQIDARKENNLMLQ